jgi:hypothetical protein
MFEISVTQKLALLGIASFALNCCAVDEDTSEVQPDQHEQIASVAELAAATKSAEASIRIEELPTGAPSAPTSGFCTTTACASDVVFFERRYWPLAWSGDYQGQRNVAFCRQSGCDGAVQINVVEACAWRVIIVTANAMKADSGDTSNVAQACNNLDESAKLLATNKANQMYQIIYGRNMP